MSFVRQHRVCIGCARVFALETLLVAVLLVAINEFSGQQQQLQCVAFGNQLVAFQSKRLRFFVNRFYGFFERYVVRRALVLSSLFAVCSARSFCPISIIT